MDGPWLFWDWQIWGLTGAVAAALVVLSRVADHRRIRRSKPDAVGFMPWTGIYFVALLVACLSLGLSARLWLMG